MYQPKTIKKSKTIGSITLSVLILFLLLNMAVSSCTPHQKDNSKYRIIHNNDGTDALGNYWFHRRPLSVADLNAYVDMVANSQVTTFMMCSGSDFPYYRSKYGRLFCDDQNGKYDCGSDTANFRFMNRFFLNILNLEKEGTDLLEASLKRAKEDKMEAFITYRMNDLHFNDTTTHCPLFYSTFWYSHPEYWINDSTPGFNAPRALDFAHKEVREQKLNMITEQLEKYGDLIDGYDLDFMRFIVYFKLHEGRKNAPLMTQLVKDVRTIIDELSARRGKKILLSVRVPATIEICLDKGLDIQEWVKQGLVDFVSIGVHWRGNTSLPVAQFKNDLGKNDIPVYASIDDGGFRPRETYSHGMLRGMASHILSQGDGLYLFNQYYGEYNSKYNGQLHLEDGGQVCRVTAPLLLQEMGSLETLKNRNKIYCLCDNSSDTYAMVIDSPLPLTVEGINKSVAAVFIGDDTRKTVPEESILFFRLNKEATCKVAVNGMVLTDEKPSYPHLYDKNRGIAPGEKEYAFLIPANCLKQGNNTVSFKSQDGAKIIVKRIDVALKYGDVQTHGYF